MADESDEWKFSVDEVGDDADDGNGAESDGSGVTVLGGDDDGPTVKVGGPQTAAEELSDDEGEGVAGPIALSTEVEAGTPTFENALFVALGVLLMLFVVVSLVVDLDLAGTVGLAAAVALVAGALYEFFRRF